MAQDRVDERGPTPEDAASQARAGHVGRMCPIDPGVGPGGTTVETDPPTVITSSPSFTEQDDDETTITGRTETP